MRTTTAGDLKVPVLGITRMPPHEDASWGHFSRAILSLQKSSAMIIDLRGNGGGDDARGFELARSVLGKQAKTTKVHARIIETAAAWAMQSNLHKLKMLDLEHQGSSIPSYLLKRYQENLDREKLAENNLEEVNRVIDFDPVISGEYANPVYHGKIYILIDSDCGSSCEGTLEALKLHPNAISVGENTAGYVNYGETGRFVLPNSRILIQVTSKHFEYPDNRNFEKVGYPPDVRIPPGVDALDYVLRELETIQS
jgi:C-terminal processing protease CtpA/Prc